MRLLRDLWTDQCGAVMSAELVMLATVGVVGATVGLNMARSAVNEEFKDLAFAIRSLDQSYQFQGYRTCKAWTAGSMFIQRPVEESLAELRAIDTDRLPQDPGPDGPMLAPKKGKVEGVDPSATPEKKPEPKKRKKGEVDEESEVQPPPVDRSNDA